MPRQIVRLEPLGINYDQPAHKLGPEVWSGGYNVTFQDGRARKARGLTPLDPPPLYEVRDLRYTPTPNDYWVYCAPDGVGVWDGVTQADITPSGWGGAVALPDPGPNSFGPAQNLCVINNYVIGNDALSGPYWWSGVTGNPMQPLPGWDALPANTYCSQMESNLYHLFALGVIEGATDFSGSRVRWSDAAPPGTVPGEWVPTPENQAGFVDLPTPTGSIVGGQTLRENMVVYKQRSTHLFQYVGGTYIYDVSTVFETIGMLAPGAVCELDGTHVLVTQDDIVQHDGNTVTSIADKAVKHEFFSNLKASMSHLVRCYLHRQQEQVWIVWPDLEAEVGCNRVLIYCYSDQTWTQRRLAVEEAFCADVGRYATPGLAGSEWDSIPIPDWQRWIDAWDYASSSAASNLHVIGTTNNLVAVTNQGTDNGQTIVAELEKTGMDFGEIDSKKRLFRAWPRFEEGDGNTVKFQFGASDFSNKQPTWQPPVVFNIGVDRSIPVNVQGRALAVRILDDDSDTWALTGIDLEYRKAGKF